MIEREIKNKGVGRIFDRSMHLGLRMDMGMRMANDCADGVHNHIHGFNVCNVPIQAAIKSGSRKQTHTYAGKQWTVWFEYIIQ